MKQDKKKQKERFEKVITECADFSDRYADSKHLEEVAKLKLQSTNYIKNQKNEQAKKANER